MYNCGIEAENHFLLESLAACQDVNSKLVMYFTVNTAFFNYLDKFSNLRESLEFPIIRNKTTFVMYGSVGLLVLCYISLSRGIVSHIYLFIYLFIILSTP